MTAAGEEGHAQEGATAGEVYDPFGLDLDLDVVTSADLVALHRAVLAQPMGGTGIVVARATGSELVDPDGTGYLDVGGSFEVAFVPSPGTSAVLATTLIGVFRRRRSRSTRFRDNNRP